MQYINFNLSEIIIVHVVKAAIIVISEHFNLSTLLVVSHVLSTKVSPEWRKNLGFKKCPFPLNRGVPSTELTDKKIMWIFARGQISRPLDGSVTWIDCSVLMKRLYCIIFYLSVQLRTNTHKTGPGSWKADWAIFRLAVNPPFKFLIPGITNRRLKSIPQLTNPRLVPKSGLTIFSTASF